jgi:hypothetical protein
VSQIKNKKMSDSLLKIVRIGKLPGKKQSSFNLDYDASIPRVKNVQKQHSIISVKVS